jgi:hypothetical protein
MFGNNCLTEDSKKGINFACESKARQRVSLEGSHVLEPDFVVE